MSGHAGHTHHHVHADAGDRRVVWAIGVNAALTLAQIIGGIAAGSLSLIADALHNFSDAVSLVIAFAARKIARRPSDATMTFGYGRAEVVAALINYTTLIVIGLYLVYEAVVRFFAPEPIAGWIIVIIAAIALAIDLVTALLTYALSKSSMNMRAAFLHNLADALGSVGVIIAGTLIILNEWWIVDPIVTLLIAGYILWQAFAEIGGAVRVLMLGTPPTLDLPGLISDMRSVEDVADVHHLHVFMIDERETGLEAHVVASGPPLEVKQRLKALLADRFGITHAMLEMETPEACCDGRVVLTIGHLAAAPHHHD